MYAIRVTTKQAVPGMKVATDIYNHRNLLVISKDTILDREMISKLKYYNIYGLHVYKTDKISEIIEESYIDMLKDTEEFKKFNRSYVESVNSVEKSFHKFVNSEKEIDLNKLIEDIDHILREGRNSAHIFEMLHGIRDYDDMTYVHSVNVSLICSIFGRWLKLPKEETKILALAGLLHDIGKVLIPKEILSKKGRLTDEEFEIVKSHSLEGYKVLKDYPIDIRIKYAALMHHERADGSGYPNGFDASQIEDFSKIVAIADVYDAMTAERQYRKAICPFDVISEFEKGGFLKFDTRYLMIFLESIVGSYVNTMVSLTDGRQGEVVMINKLSLSRPVVRIGEMFVDLSKESDLRIDSIV